MIQWMLAILSLVSLPFLNPISKCGKRKNENNCHLTLTQRDGMGREEGGGFRMGNTCIPVADSF